MAANAAQGVAHPIFQSQFLNETLHLGVCPMLSMNPRPCLENSGNFRASSTLKERKEIRFCACGLFWKTKQVSLLIQGLNTITQEKLIPTGPRPGAGKLNLEIRSIYSENKSSEYDQRPPWGHIETLLESKGGTTLRGFCLPPVTCEQGTMPQGEKRNRKRLGKGE